MLSSTGLFAIDVGDDDTYQLLLRKMVELYITVRGYSYTSNQMEVHKQAMSKGTQKAKALRRNLYDDSNE